MFDTQTECPSEQDLWDNRSRLIAWNLLTTVLVLGSAILWIATWVIVTSIIPWLATYLNDEYIDLTVKDTARQGLSRLILLASMTLLLFGKISNAFDLAYQKLGERPSK